MKKLWEIVVSDKVEPEVRKKLKRLLRPVDSAGRPEKCYFCDTETTWTINCKPVCPACSVLYAFIKEDYLPDPCEVCGKQGEFCTQGDPIHSLCYKHRDDWFKWKMPELAFIDSKKQPEKWSQVWDEGWARFIALMKEREGV